MKVLNKLKLICILFLNLSYSQDFINNKNFVVNEDQLYEYKDNNIYLYNLESLTLVDSLKVTQNSLISEEYKIILLKGKIFFYQTSGGILHKLENNKIKRIDNSYDHKLHHKSINFNYGNTLNVWGGYGFFERRKTLIFYDFQNNEWNVRTLSNSGIINGLSNTKFFILNDDKLTIFGYEVNDDVDPKITVSKQNILQIDLKKNELKKIGELSFDIKTPKDYISNEEVTILLYDKELFVVDNNNFNFKKYDINFDIDYLVQNQNGKIIYLRNSNSNFFLNNFKLEDLKQIESDNLLIKSNKNILVYTLILILLIIVLLVFLKKNKIFQKKSILKKILHKHQDMFNPKELEFIDLIFTKKQILNQDFLDFLDHQNLDQGHQNRVKKSFFKSINNKFKLITKEDLIVEEKNPKDLRQLIYIINTYFN